MRCQAMVDNPAGGGLPCKMHIPLVMVCPVEEAMRVISPWKHGMGGLISTTKVEAHQHGARSCSGFHFLDDGYPEYI